MKIEILGTESLGVRGLSCTVTLRDRKIVIDPGIALGWWRYGHLPHPFQIAVGVQIRNRIISEVEGATDIVFSHFDGDHVPLKDPNPYQLGLNAVKYGLRTKKIWAKSAETGSRLESNRRGDIENFLQRELAPAEGLIDGALQFSFPIPHGLRPEDAVSVMMTRIEEDGLVFLHASDHQFLHDESIDRILEMQPDIVMSSGPPFYLGNLSKGQREGAKQNAIRLSKNVETLIIDHHLLRVQNGLEWLKEISSISGGKVLCDAEFMRREPLLLEAWRRFLYWEMPIPVGWHEAYAQGELSVDRYLKNGWRILKEAGLIR
jgi:predicted metallo-beta-lactamase superfamily hydrolase